MSFDNPRNLIIGEVLSQRIADSEKEQVNKNEQPDLDEIPKKQESDGTEEKAALEVAAKVQSEIDEAKLEAMRVRFRAAGENKSMPNLNENSANTGEVIPLERIYSIKKDKLEGEIKLLNEDIDRRRENMDTLVEYDAEKAIEAEMEKIMESLAKIEKLNMEFDEIDEKHGELVNERMKEEISSADFKIMELQNRLESMNIDAGLDYGEADSIKEEISKLKKQKILAEMMMYIAKGE